MYKVGELVLYHYPALGTKGIVKVLKPASPYALCGKILLGIEGRMKKDVGTEHTFTLTSLTKCILLRKVKNVRRV